MIELPRRGVPIVISAPSGTGKTTLCRRLMAQVDGLAFSVSSTTRTPRPREEAGRDYNFISDATFQALVEDKAFLEWAEVHGRRYGTRREPVDQNLSSGRDVLFDIDVQGAKQLKNALDDAVLIYIVPPTLAALQERLKKRSSDAPEAIARRLAAASQELRAADFYTHWVINDDIEVALADLVAIVRSERLRRVRRDELLGRILAAAR